ncbi:hypothetical protein Y032_0039g33 [Ancylostoma ceylanicum]|uniref:Uncharacterized protein n=1 Tax=Ancylostoma ceylanicum TaxID=53326 RepID=A0A016UI23_9BILA|nr:hypothetical protein Y032_0039g33 [Ancylostoma ceylanicum]
MAICQICQKDQPVSLMRLSPTNHPTSIILLSCLARHQIDVDSASRIYKQWSTKRQHFCNAHILEATLFLGREIQQLTGEFPLNGLSGIPDSVMEDYVAHIRMYGTLLGHSICLEKKHVIDFYNDNLVEFHNDILERVEKDKLLEKGSEEESHNSNLASSADHSLSQPSTSTSPGEKIDSNVTGVKILKPLPCDKYDVKPCTSNDSSTSADDKRRLLDYSMSNTETSLTEDEDLWRMTNCAVCGVCRPEVKLRRAPKDPGQHLLLLSGLVMANALDIGTACSIYKTNLARLNHYCRSHFARAALCFGGEVRKACGQFPVRDFTIPLHVQTELLDRIKQISAKIDKQVTLRTSDFVRFYTDCQAGYHEEEGWKVLPTSLSVEPLQQEPPATSDNTFENVATMEGTHDDQQQPGNKIPASLRRPFTCFICGERESQSEGRKNSMLPGQNMIVLCCLMMGYALPLDMAKIIFPEMYIKDKRSCRKHYIQAIAFISDEIQTSLGRPPPKEFNEIPSCIRADLLTRIRSYAELINNEENVLEDHLSRFYNNCQTRYRTDTGWAAVDLWQLKKSTPIGVNGDIIMSLKRPANEPLPLVPVKQLREKLNKEPSYEQLQALRRGKCGVCGKIKLCTQLRDASAKDPIVQVLLCCLVLHDRISVETAIELYTSNRQLKRRICHEHFIFVGEFLRAEYRKRHFDGDCMPNSFLYDLNAPTNELFARLVEISKEIDAEDGLNLEGMGVSLFFADYQLNYGAGNRPPINYSGGDDCEQDFYMCGNAGVQEIPFIPDELSLKSLSGAAGLSIADLEGFTAEQLVLQAIEDPRSFNSLTRVASPAAWRDGCLRILTLR